MSRRAGTRHWASTRPPLNEAENSGRPRPSPGALRHASTRPPLIEAENATASCVAAFEDASTRPPLIEAENQAVRERGRFSLSRFNEAASDRGGEPRDAGAAEDVDPVASTRPPLIEAENAAVLAPGHGEIGRLQRGRL